jgi:glucoamylase
MATQTATTTSTATTPTVETTSSVISSSPVVTTTSQSTSAPITSTTIADVAQPITTSTTTSSSSSATTAPASSSTTTTATSATPTATNPQPKVGEVTTAGSQPSTTKSTNTVTTSQILNIVRAEQSRINAVETTTAQTAVDQAKQESAKAVNEAQTIAVNQQTQSMANAQAIATSVTPTAQSSTSSGTGLQVSSSFNLNSLNSQQNTFSIGLLRSSDLYSLTSSNQNNNVSSVTTPTVIPTYVTRAEREEIRTFEQNSAFEQRQSLSVTNPLAAMLNPPILPPAPPPAPTGPSVNAKAKDNDAAGGVSLASIAKQPQGFELYMSGLQDRPFYAPKEIYRGQRVIDNARAQRMLSGASDRLHEEMVNQQYKNLEGK